MNIALVADIHIRETTPFYVNRLMELATSLNEQEVDAVWIIGDLIDISEPTVHTLELTRRFLDEINVPVSYINGNHERLSKGSTYTLTVLEKLLGINELPLVQAIEDVSITCVGHEGIHTIPTLEHTDLLISHFRWSHSLYGTGELSKKSQEKTVRLFNDIILGDIHFRYSPVKNVSYISSPFGISYSTTQDFGYTILKLSDGKYTTTLINPNLPSKIKLKTTLSKLSALLETLDERHLYKIDVMITQSELSVLDSVSVSDSIMLVPIIHTSKTIESVDEVVKHNSVIQTLIDNYFVAKDNEEYVKSILS